MARKQKLKVYRTPIGFHDAYVAAPSQKAALKAWGSDVDLFARGVAEMVTDEALTREPLEHPGVVARRPRGTSADYMAETPDEDRPSRRQPPRPDPEAPAPRRRPFAEPKLSNRPPARAAEAPAPAEAPPAPPAKRSRPMPRPSRSELDEAEHALEQAQADHAAAIEAIRERERALQKERRDLEHSHEAEIARIEAAVAKVRERYRAALQKWRG